MIDDAQGKIVIRPEDLTRVNTGSPSKAPRVAPAPPPALPPTLPPARRDRWLVPVALVVVCGVSAGATTLVWVMTRESSQTKAIQRVGRIDKQVGAETIHAVPATAGPSRLAQAVDVYCARASKQDFTDCPPEFIVAYKQHVRAWAKVKEALNRLPDNMLEGVFMGLFNALLRGEADGGVNRLEASLGQADRDVRASWEEVERIAAKYGVVLE